MPTDLDLAIALQRRHTGVVIPVFVPAGIDAAVAAEALGDTVRSYLHQLDDPQRLVLSVDGAATGGAAAARVAADTGVRVVEAATNGGKLQAARLGAIALLDAYPASAFSSADAAPSLDYLAIVDQDGDHFANELLNLLRGAAHVRAQQPDSGVLVIGRRISRHRPMGFLRGELEELADRVLLDALAWHAAVTGRPLALEYATTLEEFPDFHSGFKVFDRATAEAVFRPATQLCGEPAACASRHAVEAVMTVEALLAGARLALVNRSTFDEQPVSTFGLMQRSRLVADKMIWPCKRLGVPAAFVDQWLRNHIPRLLLGTLTPQGHDELREIHALTVQALGLPGPAAGTPIARPRFI